MIAPPPSSLFASRIIGGRTVNASLSTELEDSAWDNFLRGLPLGQFQQSSLWSQYKQGEGWQCVRVTLEQEGQIVGGFQVLWKKTRLGKIAFVNKGPVLAPDAAELESFALDLLLGLARSHRFAAIIAQPPDESPALTPALEKRGFAPNRLLSVIDASLWIDLAGSQEAWEAKLRQTRRNDIRQALKLGAAIQEGGEADLPSFFDLMQMTCQRQGVRPNPATLDGLSQLVRTFRKSGEARIAFAVCQGERVAAVLDLKFGQRYTTWKKGWNGRHARQKPNLLLTYDSVRRAREQGCAYFDFGGIARPIAEVLLAGQPLTKAQRNHYDANKLGFAGQPKLLPPAMIYCRNPLLRLACRQIAAHPKLAARFKRLAGKL